MSEPPAENHRVVFAVDCDRTLTGPDLVPDDQALDAIAELRNAGIRCVLVTGRSKADLERFPRVATAFDAYALEGGATWGAWEALVRPSNVGTVLDAAERVANAGFAIERRSASFGVDARHHIRIRELAAGCSIHLNIDRLDVLPPGLDKGTGLDGALSAIGNRNAHVVAIGDGENDLALFDRAQVALAVGNSVPIVKETADETLQTVGPHAVIEAARRLLAGEWRNAPPHFPAAA